MLGQKEYQISDLKKLIAKWKDEGQKIVFTNGCFDILHKGHADYLYKASLLGNKLIIGLNTDESVSRIKGPDRPIQDESSRSYLLQAFGFVDAVILFNEDTPEQLIQSVDPDVLVKGKDYEIKDIVGAEWVIKKGGTVETIEFLDGYSTSSIIEKIKRSY